MTFPQHLVSVTGRVVLGASLALTALFIADANPAGASRGGDDQEIEDAGTPVTTPTTEATTTTTATTVVTQVVEDPATGDAGEGQDTQAPADQVVQAAADPAEAPMATLAEVVPAPQPRASLPRTGAGSVTQEALLGLGLVGAGLAATAAGRRSRRVQA